MPVARSVARREPTKVRFTTPTLAALKSPRKGRAYVYDLRTAGLALCVTETGGKTFYVYRRVNGRPERIRLGRFPDLSIEHARNLTAKVHGQIADGIDPQRNRRAFKTEPTLDQLFDHYLETHAKVHKRTWRADEAQFKRYLERWRNRKLSIIKKPDVKALHARIGRKHGKYAANRLVALLHTVFSKAIEDWNWKHPNPAGGITRFPEVERERFVGDDELPRFFKALESEPSDTIRDFVLVSLLTGGRRGNVLSMRWDEINLDRATWTIPAEKFKTAKPLTVPLAPGAVEILTQRRAATNGSEWVFPSYGRSGHLVEPKKAWAKILERAGLTDLRIHDLRRTLGSWQAATGASLPIIGKSLGHRQAQTTQVYARLNIDPVRAAVNAATAAMLATVKVEGHDDDKAKDDKEADGKAQK